MKPTSLPARLLALTPQGRRLFEVLAQQQAEIARLREMLRVSPGAGPAAQNAGARNAGAQNAPAENAGAEDPAILRALLRAAEAEAAFLRRPTD